MSRNIGYHTRSCENDQKIVGGTFGGQIDQETVERLTRLFTVTVKPSGTPVFVDKAGRQVRLYLSVDPRETAVGKAALKEWHAARAEQDRLEEEAAEREEQEIAELTRGLSHAEIVRRLRTSSPHRELRQCHNQLKPPPKTGQRF